MIDEITFISFSALVVFIFVATVSLIAGFGARIGWIIAARLFAL